MVLPASGAPQPLPAASAHDLDNLLAGYRAARAQESLFDVRGGAGTGYDEFLDAAGNVRPAWQELAECVGDRGRGGLDGLRAVVRSLVDNDGITYIEVDRHGDAVTNGDGTAEPGPWLLDALPLLISASDWDALESGLVQRSRLLDAVLTDLYGPRHAVTSGVLPAQLLFAHPGYVRAARGIEVPGRHQLFLHGCDISRSGAGAFRVNADWTQAPSGAGYALADRRVVAHAIPDLYERIGPRPASPALRLALAFDAAPESAEEPVVVLLSPGTHSETAFDQAYLAASVLGFPLVESADLVVRDGKLWMRSMGTLKRVDVVLRRVDADFADPLDLRAPTAARRGRAGRGVRRGAVTVVDTLGSGILESPGLLRFLPELAERLLGETPLLGDGPGVLGWYQCGAFVPVDQSVVAVDQTGDRRGRDRRTRAVGAAAGVAGGTHRGHPWQWVGQELPQFSSAPTDYYPGGLSSASVGMRLFTVSQRGGYAPMIGGLGYLLAPGNAAFKMNTVAAKDIWVRTPTRAKAERTPTAPVELPAGLEVAGLAAPATPSPTRAVSSPRVLSDLFWMGRYAERAENMARLLTVTRSSATTDTGTDRTWRAASVCRCCWPRSARSPEPTPAPAVTYADVVIATAPSHAVVGDRRPAPPRVAGAVGRAPRPGRALRCATRCPTTPGWCSAAVDRALLRAPDSPRRPAGRAGDALLAVERTARRWPACSRLSGVAAESMVQDVGWNDDGHRQTDRDVGIALTALLRATLTTVRSPGAEQTITESTLVACESSVIYRRRTLGKVSVAAVADLVLFDAENPRSLVYQLERLRAEPQGAAAGRPVRRGPSGWSTRSPPGCAASIPADLDGRHPRR